jgi:tryptophan synthase alpha chain
VTSLALATGGLRARGGKALAAFLTAGYPSETGFQELVHAADASGCDVIEIGVPFSDPIADGAVIQAASAAALERGMTLPRALDLAGRLSGEVRAPLVFMSYLNPVLRFGIDAFARAAAAAGVRGVIFPDVSFEESGALRPAMRNSGLAYVDLVAPTTGDERVRAIARSSEAFVYLVSLTGVTGAREAAPAGLARLVERVRAATDTPVYVGFGVSTAAQAREIARHADGVIIGSRLLSLAAEGGPAGAARRVGEFLAGVRRALDG